MEQYAIGIILRNTDNKAKIKLFFDKMKNSSEVQQISDKLRFFMGVATNVSKQMKDVLGANDDGIGDYYLPNMMIMEFGGRDYTEEEMKQRLTQWIGEQWMGQYQIIDSVSDLGNLLTNFKKY